MKNTRFLWWIVAIVLVGVLFYFVSTNKQTADTNTPETVLPPTPSVELEGEVTIGAVVPLTGEGAAYGLPIQQAIMLAVDEINASTGISKQKLIVKYEDGKCEGKEASTSAQKLVNVDQVQYILGAVCSGETLGLAPIINENKVITISPSATSPDITTKGGEYMFRFAPSDALAGRIAAGYAFDDLGAKTAAVLSENTDYAQALRSVFTKAFKDAGGTIVIDEAYNTGITDFRTQALKIKNAGADIVYILPQTPAPGVAIVKALRDQKMDAPLLTAEVLIGRDVAKENAELMEGVIGFEAFYDEESDRASSFLEKYEARFGEAAPFPLFMANGYSSVYLVKDLIEAHPDDIEAAKTTLSTLEGWAGGALGNVTLDENGDIEWNTYSIRKITDGKVEQIETVSL